MRSIIEKSTRIKKLRTFTQLAALVFLSMPFLGLQGISAPVFYCHGCPIASMACPLGIISNFCVYRIFPFVTVGILGLVGAIGGRFVCGWLCPFGFLQDLLYKIKSRKIALPAYLNYAKYGILVVMVILIPLSRTKLLYVFCDLCPVGTLESTIPWALMGVTSGDWADFSLRVGILVGALALAVTASRSWCRVFCPLGAIFALFNRVSLVRMSLTRHECKGCGVCAKGCPVEINPVKQMNTAECTRCLDCTTTGHIKAGLE